MKFRKKPVVIDAAQWFKHGDHPAVVAVPQSEHLKIGWNHPDNFGWVPTLEGGHVVTPGDWIIKGVKGEHYPCKPDVFAATYEPVNGSNVRDERETLTSVGADARPTDKKDGWAPQTPAAGALTERYNECAKLVMDCDFDNYEAKQCLALAFDLLRAPPQPTAQQAGGAKLAMALDKADSGDSFAGCSNAWALDVLAAEVRRLQAHKRELVAAYQRDREKGLTIEFHCVGVGSDPCGAPLTAANIYRCGDCDQTYCQPCLKKHFEAHADRLQAQPTAQEPVCTVVRNELGGRVSLKWHRYVSDGTKLYAAMQTRGQTDFAQRSSSDCTTVPGLSGDSSVAERKP